MVRKKSDHRVSFSRRNVFISDLDGDEGAIRSGERAAAEILAAGKQSSEKTIEFTARDFLSLP